MSTSDMSFYFYFFPCNENFKSALKTICAKWTTAHIHVDFMQFSHGFRCGTRYEIHMQKNSHILTYKTSHVLYIKLKVWWSHWFWQDHLVMLCVWGPSNSHPTRDGSQDDGFLTCLTLCSHERQDCGSSLFPFPHWSKQVHLALRSVHVYDGVGPLVYGWLKASFDYQWY